ncbi:hypothetical protein [Microbacterium sp. 2FI]|uniref:hypothetical protein n=1 Tax=Microbacterium sp. 2FI TaxID=2502193 RepID=UPI0010F87F15|nr:hypothetical protein [Microbacterium sp. 2FI]
MTTSRLVEVQRLATSGARAVAPYTFAGTRWIAVPQLAVDAPGTPSGINGGSSDTEVLLFAESAHGFVHAGSLPVGGAEDVEIFSIGDRRFFAVASIRSGRGPYDFATTSPVYEQDADGFILRQRISTYAAKQVRHFRIGTSDFLAVAQGMPGGDRTSVVLQWDGDTFVPLQELPSIAGYNIAVFEIGVETYLAHADHAAPSVLYRWDGHRFVDHQELLPAGGRAFLPLRDGAETYLAVARIDGESVLLKWDGEKFHLASVIPGGAGGREFARVDTTDGVFVIRVDFIHGTPSAPHPDLDSHIYRFAGGRMESIGTFPTTGGTDVAVLPGDGSDLAVSNGLSPNPVPGRTFAADTVVYRFIPPVEEGGAA